MKPSPCDYIPNRERKVENADHPQVSYADPNRLHHRYAGGRTGQGIASARWRALFWAEVDTEADLVPRQFIIFGTGHPIPNDFTGEYRGTYQLMGGALVFHVFETGKT